ncbi:hypothetical protein BJ684DRAFT_15392 [Piptocephalis cylindrospora]|uniref:Uncharacterized protein n=1 Tax=Piptocephalis cylindrospora TaxID=1907219 RepID=A0A4P9Y5H9_9FUNG|nr:hypothetical protein BJ684DRAFT_15392 [Piptocephalis cylindrospora]|eukprot:RKP14266.1 hypothetical protein BJ684DRAFT_15392 [Piptocephalis cylindrospora]
MFIYPFTPFSLLESSSFDPFLFVALVGEIIFFLAFCYLTAINGKHRSYYFMSLVTLIGMVACILPLTTSDLVTGFVVPFVLSDVAYLWGLPMVFGLLLADWIDSVGLLHPEAAKYAKWADGIILITYLSFVCGAVLFALDALLLESVNLSDAYLAMCIVSPILILLQLVSVTALFSSMKKHPYECLEKRKQLIRLATWYGLLFVVQISGLLISPIYKRATVSVGLIRAGPILSHIFLWFLYASCVYQKKLMVGFSKPPVHEIPISQTREVPATGPASGPQPPPIPQASV